MALVEYEDLAQAQGHACAVQAWGLSTLIRLEALLSLGCCRSFLHIVHCVLVSSIEAFHNGQGSWFL